MCFSIGFLEGLLIDLIWIAAIIAIIRILVPWLAAFVGFGPPIVQIFNIILWAIVAVWVVYLIFGLLSCVAGSGLGIFPHSLR